MKAFFKGIYIFMLFGEMLENMVNYTKSHQKRTRELVTTKYARLSSSGDKQAAGLWPQSNVCSTTFSLSSFSSLWIWNICYVDLIPLSKKKWCIMCLCLFSPTKQYSPSFLTKVFEEH